VGYFWGGIEKVWQMNEEKKTRNRIHLCFGKVSECMMATRTQEFNLYEHSLVIQTLDLTEQAGDDFQRLAILLRLEISGKII
jgi:hypothetical protein